MLAAAPYRLICRFGTQSVLGLLALTVTGCGWVDGTGQQTNALPTVEVLFDDGSPFTVAALPETESILITSTASDRDGVISTWRWSTGPIEQGALAQCQNQNDFDAQLAVTSLAEACGDEACSLTFEQVADVANDGQTAIVAGSLDSSVSRTAQFVATMPELDAPVGVTYRLTASDNLGALAVSEHTFCIQSVNEPPVARDDVFTLLETDVLSPSGNSRHLLSNDSDDSDVRNQPLEVVTTPVSAPFAASDFELFSDGTFRYEFGGSALVNDVEDRFIYAVTDGTFSVNATVTVRIVAVDEPPVLVTPFPPLVGIVGVELNDDFNQNVQDPKGATLTFSALTSSLPPSGDVSVSQDGILEGIPTPEDIGRYSLAVQADDGTEALDFTVPFTVIANAPIEGRAIPDQEVQVNERFTLASARYFTDPESQTIRYSVASDDEAASLTVGELSGVVTGFVSEAGTYEITVTASDGVSEPTQASFDLDATSLNTAPEFDGPAISSRTLRVNQTMTPISANFSDPEDDDLTYTVQGSLPEGLSLSAQGVISGRPTEQESAVGIRIVATDPEGLFARTNTFSLFVR